MADNEREEEENEGAEASSANANGSGSNGGALKSILEPLMRKEVLIPVATVAAGVAAVKGPDLAHKMMSGAKEKAEDGTEGLLSKAGAEGEKRAKGALQAGAAGGGVGGGGGGGGKKKTRRLPIQRWTDVAVPVEDAYELWTKFDEFPKFMHRVLSVEQDDDGRVKWQEKIWFSKRQWEGEITDQRENDRIAWKTVTGTSHTGVVSFHRIDDRLTRVMVTVDFQPTGMFEKMASGLRFVKRAVQADLARFKAYAEMEYAEGLEYTAGGAQPEGEGESEDEENGGGEEQGGGADASANGASGDESEDDESDEERERKRQERLERREQRREGAEA